MLDKIYTILAMFEYVWVKIFENELLVYFYKKLL